MPLSVERPEIPSFIAAWRNKPPEQIAEELASYSLETHGIADPYRFYFTPGGELYEPKSGCKVADTIYDKTSHQGQLEYQLVRNLEKLVIENQSGAIVWVSPPYAGVHPFAKIVVHEIEYEHGVKRLFNRAIVLDLDEQACMRLAWNLTSFSPQKPIFTNLDQMRSTPIMLKTEQSWIDVLEGLIDNPSLWTSIRNGEDQEAKELAIRQARIVQKEFFSSSMPINSYQAEMAVLEMLGPRPTNCPPAASVQSGSALQVISENALTYYGSSVGKDPDFCKNCPVCGETINCIVRNGQSCPECGAVKRCG